MNELIFGMLMLCLLRPPCLHTAVNASGREIRVRGYTGRQKKEERRRFVGIRSRQIFVFQIRDVMTHPQGSDKEKRGLFCAFGACDRLVE